MEEQLQVSDDYKKAFNKADFICNYMPHLLKEITIPEKGFNDYTQGFKDRVQQYDKEVQRTRQDAMQAIRDRYAKEINAPAKNSNKDKGMDKE